MEGPKPFEAKPQPAESLETPETLEESIERALEVYAQLQEFNNVEVIGGEAMALNARAEELAGEFKQLLEQIPAKDCLENKLPYHPSDIKPAVPSTPFPKLPDYPTPANANYSPAAKAA